MSLELAAAAKILSTDFAALARLAAQANTAIKTISTPTAVVEGQASLVFTVTLSGATTSPDAFEYSLAGTGLNPMPTNGYGTPTFSNGVTASGNLIAVPVGVSIFTVTVPTSVVGYYTTPKDLTLTISDKFATGQIQSVPETIVPWASSGFGFVGDGIADDTAAFEAAMASPMSIDFTGCKIRLTRYANPTKTLNAYGLSGRWIANPSGTTWTTETRLRTFTDYNGVLKTISVQCAKVNVLGTHKAEIIFDNSTGMFDIGALKITEVKSSGGSLPAQSRATYSVAPIVDGVVLPPLYSTNEYTFTNAGQQIALSWAAYVPYSGTLTGYRVYGRNGILGDLGAGTTTFTDTGSITPTGSRPYSNADGVNLKGKFYGWEFRGFRVSVKWPSDPTRSQASRFGTGFDPNYQWAGRLHFGFGGIFDIVGLEASDNFFDYGDALHGTVFGMTIAGSHSGVPCRLKDIHLHHNYYKSNNALEFLDRSSTADVAWDAKTITNVLIEDNDFDGQGQAGYPLITNYRDTGPGEYHWMMGISLDGAAHTHGYTVRRNRFWNMEYTAFEMVWYANAGQGDLDLAFDANNNIVDASSGLPFTFNNAAGSTDTHPKAYNFTLHHNYFGNSINPTALNSIRDSVVDSNIFERTNANSVKGTAWGNQSLFNMANIHNMLITGNYFGDVVMGAGYLGGINFGSGNTVSGNYFEGKNNVVSGTMGANNKFVENILNYDVAGSNNSQSMLLLGSASNYSMALNNTVKNKVYIPAAQAGNAKLIYDFTGGATANIRDTSTMFAGGSLLTQFPKTIVTWTGALVDLSVGNWHLADNFTLSGAATAAWECKLPGAQGNRTITNVSGQACTISCQASATKYVIPNGQTKTINVAADYAVTVVV